MALADYFHRSAVAAAQVLQGYDEAAIRERLEASPVTLAVSDEAARSSEGTALADLTVRLLARLYPTLSLQAPEQLGLHELARAINPDIELTTSSSQITIAIGSEPHRAARTIYAGSDGYTALLSASQPQPVGTSDNPFGPGVAACLAVANLFRVVFLSEHAELDDDVKLSTLTLRRAVAKSPQLGHVDIGEAALVGAGAIGHGAAWALARSPISGLLHIVDPERLDLGNLQRYVLAAREDVDREKAPLLAQHMPASLDVRTHVSDWQHFCSDYGYDWARVIVGVDSAAGRRATQATLPRWIANAWTQPGDLGVSVHPWTETGACVSCLYLPNSELPSDDHIIARALGLAGHELEVRRLLHTGQPVPRALLTEIARALSIPDEWMDAFAGRSLRELYVEGVCGGELISLARVGQAPNPVHVPVAHQSALAGVLLAGRLVADAVGHGPASTEVMRINLMRALGHELLQSAAKDPRGICICQDPVYRSAYSAKWSELKPADGSGDL